MKAGQFIFATVAVGMQLATPQASAETKRFTLATMAVPGETVPLAAEQFAQKMKEKVGEDFEIIYNDSLLSGPELAPGVRDGRVEMAVTTYPYLTSAEPRFGVTNLPGLIDGPEQYRTLVDGFLAEEWEKLWADQWNAVPLVEGVWTPVTLMTTTPIRTVEDFQGKRIRVSNVETAEFVTELGASPVPIPAGEIMSGLERGVIDGFVTAVCYSYEQGFFNVAKYINNWGISPATGWTIVVNKDQWDALSPETQSIMREVGDEVELEMWDLFNSMKDDCYAQAAAAGVEIIEVGDTERSKAYASEHVDPVFSAYYERAKEVNFDGKAFVDRARAMTN